MSTSPRLWAVVATVTLAMALLPTAATSEDPPGPPCCPLEQDPWEPGGGDLGSSTCVVVTFPVDPAYCSSRLAQMNMVPGVWFFWLLVSLVRGR